MQIFWSQACVALQHLPIAVARYWGNLLDREARLKKPIGSLVPQVVKMQVLNLELGARTPKRRAGKILVERFTTSELSAEQIAERSVAEASGRHGLDSHFGRTAFESEFRC